jgi:pimeloyl-ACP methyl ester carboxylesterase
MLLHGWGCSLYSFRFLLPLLGEMGYRAVAVDLPGHGLSDKPLDPRRYSLAAMTEHALQTADALGLGEFEVMGHSMGGRIAVEMALSAEVRVKRLWLLNPVGFGPMPHVQMARPWARPAAARVAPTPLPSAVVRFLLGAVYGRVGSYQEGDVQEYRAPTQFRGFLMASAFLLRHFDWGELAPDVAAPARARSVVVSGELDRVVQMVRRRAHHNWMRLGWNVGVVRDVAHVVHEEAPEAVMKYVRDSG